MPGTLPERFAAWFAQRDWTAHPHQLAMLEPARTGELDAGPPRAGGLDVLAQHLPGLACSAPFAPDDVFEEVRAAAPMPRRAVRISMACWRSWSMAATRSPPMTAMADLFRDSEGRLQVRTARIAAQHRMNIGTAISACSVALLLSPW